MFKDFYDFFRFDILRITEYIISLGREDLVSITIDFHKTLKRLEDMNKLDEIVDHGASLGAGNFLCNKKETSDNKMIEFLFNKELKFNLIKLQEFENDILFLKSEIEEIKNQRDLLFSEAREEELQNLVNKRLKEFLEDLADIDKVFDVKIITVDNLKRIGHHIFAQLADQILLKKYIDSGLLGIVSLRPKRGRPRKDFKLKKRPRGRPRKGLNEDQKEELVDFFTNRFDRETFLFVSEFVKRYKKYRLEKLKNKDAVF